MKDLLIAVSTACSLAVGMAVWKGISVGEPLPRHDEEQYREFLSKAGSAEILARGSVLAQLGADRLAGREWLKLIFRTDDDKAADAIARMLSLPARRLALVVAMAAVLLPLVLASLAVGLYLRQESLFAQRWRSPTVAYLAKKSFFYPGLLGVMVFCTLPMSLPLWLIYVVFIPLCGGLMVYVGSIGRI